MNFHDEKSSKSTTRRVVRRAQARATTGLRRRLFDDFSSKIDEFFHQFFDEKS